MFWRAAVLVFLIDQVVKWWATHSLMLDQSVPVLPPYFYLTLTHNTGIAFGLLEGRGWLTIPLTLCVAGGLVWYQCRQQAAARCAVADRVSCWVAHWATSLIVCDWAMWWTCSISRSGLCSMWRIWRLPARCWG
jgi:hypothetical protein